MSDTRYAYYAFISYSRKDAKWAKWLQRKLESYRLPSTLRKELDGRAPLKIRPVFRDQTDIGAGLSVQQNLRRELADSRYLIVICSPESAKSEWVDLEIRSFQAMGRGDRIIPFIVEGSPTPNPENSAEEQCYPPSLLADGDIILGASLKELSAKEALIKIIAAILGLKFDQLWQRHKRRERVQRFQIALAACMALAAIFWGADHYLITHIRYFDDYVDKWGAPQGIGQLSKEQCSHRQRCWRIEIKEGRATRLVRVDSGGLPRDYDNTFIPVSRSTDQRYEYTKSGRLNSISEYSATGQFIQKRIYSEDLKELSYQYKTGIARKSVTAKTAIIETGYLDNLAQFAKGDIVGERFSYDSEGRVLKVFYLNYSGHITRDSEGVYGKAMVYTPEGRLQTITYLDQNGKPYTIKGVAGCRFLYANSGHLKRLEWINVHQAPVVTPDGISVIENGYDIWGNNTTTLFKDPAGIPCYHQLGMAEQESFFNEQGFEVKQVFYDIERKPILRKQGIAGWEAVYDKRGNQIRLAFFDVESKPCLSQEGVAGWAIDYDQRGYQTKQSFLGTDGNPYLVNGVAGWEAIIDKDGRQTQITFLGIDGKPSLNKDGVAKVKKTYSEQGNQTEEMYFDTNGQPCFYKEGNAGWKAIFDDQGNQIKQEYLGLDGKPCLHKDGNAGWNAVYDQRGNQIKFLYFGPDGKPCLYRDGFAGWEA
ncbi:MAG: toll/interleukin-1 receptor domain-containing protein, partial [Desulfobulbus sp.]|nr:toll/interleukin-1 receptor domain-containing protein [Desulfobulbus sp.]